MDPRSPHDEIIYSPANPTIRLARSLNRRRIRQRERAILIEGIRAVTSAVENGIGFRTVLIDESRRDQVDADLVSTLRRLAQRIVLVDADLFLQIAETEHPQPVIAICDMPDLSLPQDCTLVLAIDGVRDPGNLGTLIRTAAAAGVDGVALLHGTVDRFNAKVIRSTAGAIFNIPVHPFGSIADIVTHCYLEKPAIVLATGDGELAYDQVDWRRSSLLIVGGEATGPSTQARTYADIGARIPIDPSVESLNAAVAGAVILFEANRQRRSAG